jgi:predicted nucleotide-binding protein (sugar kinase/HSP70/actin superfamily)
LRRVGVEGMKVGFVDGFTGHYRSARMLARFLELAGAEVVHSGPTTPSILETGATLASADFCVPLRVYVGHVHSLVSEHPDMEFLLAPNVLSEDGASSTCAKYRDVGGVAIRSLVGTVNYLAGGTFPRVLAPDIWRLAPIEARNACYDVYAEMCGWPRAAHARLAWPRGVTRDRLWPELTLIETAARQAYEEVIAHDPSPLARMVAQSDRPRLAIVGRPYLADDATISCDLANWFARRGVNVITARCVPRRELRIDEVKGYYDSHRELEAFTRWSAQNGVDGAVVVGSFGCHPDAFQTDHFVNLAQRLGMPAWPVRFDENSARTGFYTRYETILAFLERRRDRRLAGPGRVWAVGGLGGEPSGGPSGGPATEQPPPQMPAAGGAIPVITWPYMGEALNCAAMELLWQLGIAEFAVAPSPVSDAEMLLGNDCYTEACSPFSLVTGGLRRTVDSILTELERAQAQGEAVASRRIVILMLHGEGPCAFGWYSMAQRELLTTEFAERLARGGHTLQMCTASMNGVSAMLRPACPPGRATMLGRLLDLAEHRSSLARLRAAALVIQLVRSVWAKLRAAERLSARMLIANAHELERGSVAAAYRSAMELLSSAHGVKAIRAAERAGLRLIDEVPGDGLTKPRVVAVGEIYAMMTSYANRGSLRNLLGREGVEVVEGIFISKFIRHSVSEMVRRAIAGVPPVKSVRERLKRVNIHILPQRLRDPRSCPFLLHEVGGEGVPSVAAARRAIEDDAVDGIVHVHPFKCMPEAIGKDALKEMAEVYGVRYLALTFDRETEIERLLTEIGTFAAVLAASPAARIRRGERRRRIRIGRGLDHASGHFLSARTPHRA